MTPATLMVAPEHAARLAHRRDLSEMLECGRRVGRAQAAVQFAARLRMLGMGSAADEVTRMAFELTPAELAIVSGGKPVEHDADFEARR